MNDKDEIRAIINSTGALGDIFPILNPAMKKQTTAGIKSRNILLNNFLSNTLIFRFRLHKKLNKIQRPTKGLSVREQIAVYSVFG